MLRVGGLFTGIGAHHSALERLKARHPDLEYEVVFQCEYDRQTAKAYDRIHGKTLNLGDVTKVGNIGGSLAVDLLMVSPPCQDISVAGKQMGLGEGTRSGLIHEIPRIVRATEERERPRIIVWEEVPTLVSPRFEPVWLGIVAEMEALGYRSSWRIMNAADFGVPQSRRRFFAVSVLGSNPPRMPEPFPLEKRMRDYLDTDVPEDYFLSEERVKGLVLSTEKQREKRNGYAFHPHPPEADTVAHSVTTRGGGRKTDNFLLVRR